MGRAVLVKKTASWNVAGVTVRFLGFLLASSSLANAQSFTVSNGQTVTTTQNLAATGSVGTIEEGGAILTNGVDAITTLGNIIRVENNGNIAASGGAGRVAINSSASNFELINNGLISAPDALGFAIRSNGADTRITNNGTISGNAVGILNGGNSSIIINNGTIVTSADNSTALASDADGTQITNTGTIEVLGFGTALQESGNGVSITNSGLIRSRASQTNNTTTVLITGNNATIANSGSIISEGSSGTAILFDFPTAVSATVTNSGFISSALDGFAIEFRGDDSNDTLNLQRGGVIQGRLAFGTGFDTFNVERGISLDYTFEPGVDIPEVINANGATVTRIGNRVVIIDPSSVEVGPSLGSEVAGAVFDTLEDRIDRTYDALEDGSIGSSNGVANPFGVWGATFANVAKLPSNNGFNSSTTAIVGTVVGADVALNDTVSGGVLGGFAQARFNQDGGADNSSPSGFGGIYANYGDLFSMALLGGTSSGGYTREILNNTVLGGIVRTEEDRDGFFIAPEVTARTPKFELGSIKVQASARGRMIFERLDGVIENANGVPVEVNATSNRTYEARVQLGFDVIDNETTSVKIKTGLDARTTSGFDDTRFTLFGQTQRVQQSPRDEQAFGGFIGGTFQHRMSDNVDIFASSEVGIMSDVDFAADFSAGIKIKF